MGRYPQNLCWAQVFGDSRKITIFYKKSRFFSRIQDFSFFSRICQKTENFARMGSGTKNLARYEKSGFKRHFSNIKGTPESGPKPKKMKKNEKKREKKRSVPTELPRALAPGALVAFFSLAEGILGVFCQLWPPPPRPPKTIKSTPTPSNCNFVASRPQFGVLGPPGRIFGFGARFLFFLKIFAPEAIFFARSKI